jgi:hypothetical protein
VLTGLGHEHHGSDAADLHRGLIGEVPDAPSHVVRFAAVEVPFLELVIVGVVIEESLHAWLIDVEQSRRGERRHGVGVRGS